PRAEGTQQPAVQPLRLDHHGDPLPPDAVVRFGTVRWRNGGSVYGFSADGRRLITDGPQGNCLCVWDAATGKERHRFGRPLLPQPRGNDGYAAAIAKDGRT